MICASQLANLYGFSRVRAVVHAHTCTASHPLAVLRPRPSLAPVKFCLSKKMTLPIAVLYCTPVLELLMTRGDRSSRLTVSSPPSSLVCDASRYLQFKPTFSHEVCFVLSCPSRPSPSSVFHWTPKHLSEAKNQGLSTSTDSTLYARGLERLTALHWEVPAGGVGGCCR